ncbi:MAG: histidine kinase, partial [Microbacteriaceae bacterium]
AIPFVGLNTIWFWLYVPIMASFSWQSRRFALATIAIVVLAQLAVIGIAGQFVEYWYAVALTASLGIMMFAFGRQIQGIIKLQAAQQEVARLAVVEERARFSRDLHDVLGHSLTVVTVKSELARRLVSLDPTRAEAEIADIERLARAALADLRAAVAGYREIALSTELAAAHVALTAADIEAHLPPNSDSAAADSAAAEPAAAEPAADLRELFGWVLREAVTNVVRHSGARNCWVHVTRTELTVDDDGHGITDAPPRTSATGSLRRAGGVGLLGLRERAEKAGAELTVTTNERGGVQVAVRRAA